MNIRDLFDKHAKQYDAWYDRNLELFKIEVETLKRLRRKGRALEIGVGTGRFAEALHIDIGIDISLKVLHIAKFRGTDVILADARYLPFKNEVFEEEYMIFTICFLKDIDRALDEAYRTLRKFGRIIIAFIPKESPLGKKYIEEAKKGHIFYSHANFLNLSEVIDLIRRKGFKIGRVLSSLGPQTCKIIQGYDSRYSFCCIEGIKNE